MCGIAGYLKIGLPDKVGRSNLEKMISSLKHRGPDGYGLFLDDYCGLAHSRLSIIDLEGGWQPIHNEDKSLWITFNGEIFNYIELRKRLEKKGHTFYTHSDTEVIVHLYEELQEECLHELNGQFAFCIYDAKNRSFFLARDRMGIRPLFYTFHCSNFYFASEIKAVFSADLSIPRKINQDVLKEVFYCWAPVGNETVFEKIYQLEAGNWLKVDTAGNVVQKEYWDLSHVALLPQTNDRIIEKEWADQLKELLVDSIRLQLRSDVPVGAYLSGGLDSSVIASLVRNLTDNKLKTFSVNFVDTVYDESDWQQEMVDFLRTDHHAIRCGYKDIADSFLDVIWHTETPVLRTAPAPLYLLSSLVREKNYKVVLTGEGADEIFGGYDIFKEAKIRAFISRFPGSSFRPFLLKRLYPYLPLSPIKSAAYAQQFFNTDSNIQDCFYAHRPRWKTTSRVEMFFSEAFRDDGFEKILEKLHQKYEKQLHGKDYFTRAQFLEAKILLSNYLLSSQGDRMAMAHSVEGRFPFLDHRVVEFAFSLPPAVKMRVLNEKYILKKSIRSFLPSHVIDRKKQPYMAPDILSFFGDDLPCEYLDYYLGETMLKDAGFFLPKIVSALLAKCHKKKRQGFMENMAFTGMLSTQILYDKFVKHFQNTDLGALKNVRVMS